jgi:hypothetical protein
MHTVTTSRVHDAHHFPEAQQQYVAPTPALARELHERMARSFPGRQCTEIPTPARVLAMLRELARGRFLLASGGGASVYLENFPDVVMYAQLFFSCGWLEPVKVHVSGNGASWWGLSERGRRKLEEGLEWWRSLSRRERLWRALADGSLLA